MDAVTKAKQLLAELLEPGVSPPSTFYKILLLGIRDAYEYQLDLMAEGEVVDRTDRLLKYYAEAQNFWKIHDRERAIYYLGGALHYLQDAWLGLTDTPEYEIYLQKTIRWDGLPMAERTPSPEADLGSWVREAETERQRFGNTIQELTNQKEEPNPPKEDQVSVYLAQRAQAAGAALLIQFFLDAERV